ncbi:MAG: heme anaerobic degradation radical SAM methyltransferase ChuW/HutW [Candidatus Cloacimonadota bacterium]|nr:MAG: heme anaerobic degradation radical SAM methyltransferase ChuW/HutW [Candidatus Cloacimonadota bacterium]PIE77373.1 MAG: heme anaerobic degradation radical SAM methyltransferase ChuW/HutW [Candidatus Delongbacteria bacterium]
MMDLDKIMESFYACAEGNPLYNAFPEKKGVHPFSSGEEVTEPYHEIWNKKAPIEIGKKDTTIYIHVPFCRTKCTYCPFYFKKSSEEEINKYFTYLKKEIEITAKSLCDNNTPIRAVYFGGGTPTDLSSKQIKEIIASLKSNFNIAPDCEITLEGRVIGYKDGMIDEYLEGGVSRFSLGVQTFNTDIRRSTGRLASREEIIYTLNSIKRANGAPLVIDLIYGLPNQTMETWKEDLNIATNYVDIDGVDLYQLNVIPNTVLFDQIHNAKKFSPTTTQQKADFFKYGKDFMAQNLVRRQSLKHWGYSNRERGVYNTLTRYGRDCIPLGNRSGGKFTGYSISQAGSMEDYYSMIDRGIKPINTLTKLPESDNFFSELSGQIDDYVGFNFNRLKYNENFQNMDKKLSRLLTQWEEVGIISKGDFGWYKLTESGQFWALNIYQKLKGFISMLKEMENGNSKMKSEHPHAKMMGGHSHGEKMGGHPHAKMGGHPHGEKINEHPHAKMGENPNKGKM